MRNALHLRKEVRRRLDRAGAAGAGDCPSVLVFSGDGNFVPIEHVVLGGRRPGFSSSGDGDGYVALHLVVGQRILNNVVVEGEFPGFGFEGAGFPGLL